MIRIVLLGVLSANLYGQYAASDDGTIVYFSRPALTINSTSYGWRLFAWTGGAPYSVINAPAGEFVRLITLSSDGRRFLVRRSTGFEVWRHGATAPLLALPAAAVAMSRNGRWLAAIEPNAATRWELTDSGVRAAGTLPGTLLRQPPHGGSFVADDGTVNLQCDDARSCAWDGQRTISLPAYFPPDGVGPFLYRWNNTEALVGRDQELEQYDWRNQKTVVMPKRCAKRAESPPPFGIPPRITSYLSQASLGASDPSGRHVVAGCLNQFAVFDSVSGVEQPLPREAVLDTTLTRVLSRLSADRFAWVPVDRAVPSVGRFEDVQVSGPVTAYGLLTAISDPDYTLTWGGQPLPWLRGSGGYSYAPLPADLVSGAIDAVAIRSESRPWWNTTISVPAEPSAPTAVPMFYGDPWVLFQHGDYRGFLIESSPARRGDHLHFLISGVLRGTTADAAVVATFMEGSARSSRTLPVVAVSPTPYHPAITQITVKIPEDAIALPARGVVASFSLRMWSPDRQSSFAFSTTAYFNYRIESQ